MTPYRWPLAVSPFSILDRLKIAAYIVGCDRYTMGSKVAELEEKFSIYSGRRALMVSNGSTANQLVFELWKVKNPGVVPVVICPAVTWISSVSPALMAGMEVVFADINLEDFSLDLAHVEKLLAQYKDRRVIIWPTALIGFTPDMGALHKLAAAHGNAEVYLDACENTLAEIQTGEEHKYKQSILASAPMTTTSLYLSHYVCSVEGGFVFFQDLADYELGRMFRNHGMVRSLPANNTRRARIANENPTVDERFLFAVAGTNLRPSDVHAAFGLADFERIDETLEHRQEIYSLYKALLDPTKYYLPPPSASHVAFCLPIFVWDENKLFAIKQMLEENGIESRPIIGSHLGYQPALKHLFTQPIDSAYPNAEWVHRHGCYVGLHKKVTPTMVRKLALLLNTL